jgi:PD-(D/E)XK endonuclease
LGENNRYDLIIEKEGVLARVQVKTGGLCSGSVVFDCYSSHLRRSGVECRRYVGEVEYFTVFCPEVAEVYLIPAEDLDVLQGSLRMTPARNGQRKGIRLASSYRISKKIRQN